MGARSSKQQEAPQHRLLNSGHPAVGYFTNATQLRVHVEWLDYRGQLKPYAVLSPGQTYRQERFCCHPWKFVREDGEAVLVAEGQQVVYLEPGDMSVVTTITEAAPMPWCPKMHTQFLRDFRQRALMVLLCHVHSAQQQHPCNSVRRAGRLGSRGQADSLAARLRANMQVGGAALPGVQAGATQRPTSTALGSLQLEVLLSIIALAAPYVPKVVRPGFPPGAAEGDCSPEERRALFDS